IVAIASPDREKVAEAERQVMLIVDPPSANIGEVYEGRVVNITKFGAFVNVLPGRDGLVHISKLGGGKRIDKVEDVLELGQSLEVVVEDIDPNGKISLRPTGDDSAPRSERSSDDSAPRPERSSDDRDDGNPVEDADDLDASDDRVDDFVDGSDDDFEDDEDDFGDAPGSSNRDEPVAVSASFEDAFQAELETVHGDLGAAAHPERSGGRRRRSR
ncbi:MAG: S1 RNA-binding domain-containing protein, partial [Acidimicrobiales bacterium]|nr:S1 RNA-binding domain-containing protein [Acidimicrobiales bacterium]